jgi:hypothetical protein
MANEYLEVQKRLKRIESIFLRAYCEYVTFNELEKLRAPDLIGKDEASKNLELLNHYQNFFQVTIEALRTSFLTKTAKLFDTHRGSLHLDSLINFIASNKDDLTVEEFIKQNKDRPFLSELIKKYSLFTNDDILMLQTKLKEASDIRERVKTYRDKSLSHEDLKIKKVDIYRDDIDKLFELLREILNFISNKIDFSTTTFTLAEEDCQRDVKSLIDNLRLGYNYKIRQRLHRLRKAAKSV